MRNYLQNLYKPFRTAIFILIISTGCREEGTERAELFTYTDAKFSFNAIAKDSNNIPVLSFKNISM
jgi:hypothetical protein